MCSRGSKARRAIRDKKSWCNESNRWWSAGEGVVLHVYGRPYRRRTETIGINTSILPSQAHLDTQSHPKSSLSNEGLEKSPEHHIARYIRRTYATSYWLAITATCIEREGYATTTCGDIRERQWSSSFENKCLDLGLLLRNKVSWETVTQILFQ